MVERTYKNEESRFYNESSRNSRVPIGRRALKPQRREEGSNVDSKLKDSTQAIKCALEMIEMLKHFDLLILCYIFSLLRLFGLKKCKQMSSLVVFTNREMFW